MTIRRVVIAAIAAAGFSLTASAAQIAQPAPIDTKSPATLVHSHSGSHHLGHHGFGHHGHWHHGRHWRGGPGCFWPFPAPFCWY